MRFLFPAILLASACATTRMPNFEPAEPHARVVLAPLTADGTIRLLPHAIEPLLPSADRIARVVEARLGDTAMVDVHYCVSPQGRVTTAKLERSSSFDAFDQAVMADVVGWQFSAQPGPDALRTCETATVVYRAHRS
jgi:TonB family protein